MKEQKTKVYGVSRHHVTRAAQKTNSDKSFGSVRDVSKYFEENADRLADYVESGLPTRKRQSKAVLGVHIGQLARLAGIQLVASGCAYETLPESLWTCPDTFSNIDLILTTARAKFPTPLFN